MKYNVNTLFDAFHGYFYATLYILTHYPSIRPSVLANNYKSTRQGTGQRNKRTIIRTLLLWPYLSNTITLIGGLVAVDGAHSI